MKSILRNKRVLLSGGIILALAAIITTGTIAFYADTETSTDNIFVAGSVDLKVDHTYAMYNGDECVGNCEEVGENLIVNGGFENPDVANWTVFTDSNDVPGWDIFGVGLEIQDNAAGSPHSGSQHAELDSHGGTPDSQSGISQVIATTPGQQYRLKFWHSPRPNNGPDTDNAIKLDVEVTSNSGTIIDTTIGQPSYTSGDTDWTEYVYNFIALDTETTIRFDDAGSQGDTLGGYLDDVSVYQLNCEGGFQYGGICTLWGERDLGKGDTFWNFSDIKPGDWGQNSISLHVYSNDAYSCLFAGNIEDDENTVLEPELTAGDTSDDGVGYGELSDMIEFFVWHDSNANNAYDNGEDILVDAGTAFNQLSNVMGPLALIGDAPIDLVGMSWCAGDQTGPTGAAPETALSCDGNGMTNVAQSDKVTADFVAYAVQQRNNEDFTCEAAAADYNQED